MEKNNATKIAILETNITNIMEKLEEFQLDNKEQHTAIMEAVNKLESKLDYAIGKKADKWVEKILIWAGMTIGAGILTLIVRWVILIELQ